MESPELNFVYLMLLNTYLELMGVKINKIELDDNNELDNNIKLDDKVNIKNKLENNHFEVPEISQEEIDSFFANSRSNNYEQNKEKFENDYYQDRNLFPLGWLRGFDVDTRIDILNEAIEKKVSILNTDGYKKYIEGKRIL